MPDHKEAREASLQEATSVYDLLSIGMARRGQYAMLSEVREQTGLVGNERTGLYSLHSQPVYEEEALPL